MLKNDLLQLNFTNNQASVYLALVETGETKVGTLIEKTGFHRNIVYRALVDLENRKLATRTSRRGVTYYSPTDPEELVKQYERQKVRAQEVVDKIAPATTGYPEVLLLRDRQGVHDLLEMNLECTTDILLLGVDYSLNRDPEYKEIYDQYEQRLVKKATKRYVLAYPDFRMHEALIKNAQTRYLPKSFPYNPLVINIFGDSTAQIVWGKPAVITVTTHKTTTDAYRDYFWLLWEMAKGK